MLMIDINDPKVLGMLKIAITTVWVGLSFVCAIVISDTYKPKSWYQSLKVVMLSMALGAGASAAISLILGLINYFY